MHTENRRPRQPTLARKVRWLRAIDRAAVIFRATRNEPLNEDQLARVLRLSMREIVGFLDYVIAEQLLEGVIMAGDDIGVSPADE